MPRVTLTLAELERRIARWGWEFDRQNGRHRVYKNRDTGQSLTLAVENVPGKQIDWRIVDSTFKEIRAMRRPVAPEVTAIIDPPEPPAEESRPRERLHAPPMPRREQAHSLLPYLPAARIEVTREETQRVDWSLELPVLLGIVVTPKKRLKFDFCGRCKNAGELWDLEFYALPSELATMLDDNEYFLELCDRQTRDGPVVQDASEICATCAMNLLRVAHVPPENIDLTKVQLMWAIPGNVPGKIVMAVFFAEYVPLPVYFAAMRELMRYDESIRAAVPPRGAYLK